MVSKKERFPCQNALRFNGCLGVGKKPCSHLELMRINSGGQRKFSPLDLEDPMPALEFGNIPVCVLTGEAIILPLTAIGINW